MLKKLNNMKVKKRLLVCFIMIALTASISGILGVILMINMDTSYSRALVENGFAQGQIGNFNTYLNKGSALVRDTIFLEEESEVVNAQKELEEITQKMNAMLAQLKENCTTPEELKYIAVIDEKLPLYEQKKNEVVELGLTNRNDEALEMFRLEARPLLNEAMTAAQNLMDLNVTMGNEKSASLTNANRIIIVVIIAVILAVLFLAVTFAVKIADAFAKPIVQVKEAAVKLSHGSLDIEVNIDSEDELGEMGRAFSKAVHMLKLYILEIDRVLAQVAANNFNVRSEVSFEGDFVKMEEALETIISSLSRALYSINEASDQVTLGAGQMAESAQALAEGAADQAGSIEELTATIENVSQLMEDNARNAGKSYEDAKGFEREAEKGNGQMQQLSGEMDVITETSKEIENIIGQIEDIASQTNLLSLNASIEAARAGEAGKGFAVVADQIGKLASDSAQSAVNTRELIGHIIEEINRGSEMTAQTSEAIAKVIEGINKLAESCRQTRDMSVEQSEAMKQIEEGIEQISGVVQNNSATAEETSATSEELSAQAQNLRSMVEQFKLREDA